jgi:hypothetical protein
MHTHFLPHRVVACIFTILLAFTCALSAEESSGPKPSPLPPPIASPLDKPYEGKLSLAVDVTNIADRILNVRETIPVKAGEITLLYPQWLPGTQIP